MLLLTGRLQLSSWDLSRSVEFQGVVATQFILFWMMTEHSARWGGIAGQSVSKIVLQGVAFTGSHSYEKEKTNTGRSGNNERVWSPAETHAKGVNSCGWTHLQEVWTAGREDSQTSPVWLWGLRTGRIHQVWFGVKGAAFSKRIWPVVYKSIGMTLTGVRNIPLWLKCFGMWPTHGIDHRHLGDKDDEIWLLGVNKTSQDPILLIWGFLPQVESLRLQFTSDSRNVECHLLHL